MSSDKNIHPIVRAIIVKEGYILLTNATNSNMRFDKKYHFLPGGHIEHGESSLNALKREMAEEIGDSYNLTIKGFLGMLECTWQNTDSFYHEINIVYLASIEKFDINNPPISKENHIEYNWFPIKSLKSLNLLPRTFSYEIPKWLEIEKNSCFDVHELIKYEFNNLIN